jgi:hypothetical protein
MKKLCIILAAITITSAAWAQSPQKMSYQAVIRDAGSILVASHTVGMQISILQGSAGGTVVYSETQTPSTNANGLVTIEIGSGAGFNLINWANGPYFIKTETDPTGGSNYTITGTNQLLSVPYALHAVTAESISGGIAETDPVFFVSPAHAISNGNLSDWNTAFGWGNHASAGYLTGFSESDPIWTAASGNYYTKSNLQTSGASQFHFNNLINKPTTLAGYGISDAFDGNYNSLTNTPVLFDGSWLSLSGKPNFSTVATSGNYADLLNLPLLFDGDYNSLQNKPSLFDGTWISLLGKPTFATVATSGSYSDLSDKPVNVSSFGNDAGYLTTETQALSVNSYTISLTNGGHINLPDGVASATISHDSLYLTFLYGQVVNAGYVGNGKPGSSLSSVITSSISGLGYSSVTVNGNITNAGNEFILTRGVCLSAKPQPGLGDTVFVNGTGPGSFTTVCNQLAPNTTYHVRAFATNTVGSSFGNELSFVTKALTIPVLATQSVSNLTNTSAISGGNISDEGGTPVLGRGVCWSLSASPTLTDHVVPEGVGAGSYIVMIAGLTPNTLYHVRAYATNAQGTSYGNDISFTTIILQTASLTTNAVSNISYTKALSGGNITNDNGSSVTSRGICWATTASPTTANSINSQAGGLGTFTDTVSGLTANTTYYVRAFAINGGGTSYGNQVSFVTLPMALPALTTKPISGISSNLAGSGGTITSDGGSSITAKGVCWSLNPAPTIANNKTTDGTGLASYNSTMTGLNPVTLYYVRAYATNGLGTVYGNEINFTTTNLVNPGPTVPILGTSTSVITGSSTASSGGYVSSDGGSAVTVRGVCWSTTTNPTLANSFSTDGGTGLGYFTSAITGISGCGTVYYVRAYATNSTGTGYGTQNTISTGLLSTLSTNDITSIGNYTAVSGGVISDNGGCPVTQKGVCWNYVSGPTTGNAHTSDGSGNASFVSNLTGLNGNRTYYVRAYTTNSVGTTYGPEKSFVTNTPPSPYIGQNYGGGIVFYIDGTGIHGLVSSTSDQGSGVWGCSGTDIPTDVVLGSGATNTASIVASCSESNIAAKICDNLVLNGYSDWFLASRDECTLIYTNLAVTGLMSFSGLYWTSSQGDANTVGYYNFYNGGYYGTSKTSNLQVRAIRAF